jgi:hypothetical protein
MHKDVVESITDICQAFTIPAVREHTEEFYPWLLTSIHEWAKTKDLASFSAEKVADMVPGIVDFALRNLDDKKIKAITNLVVPDPQKDKSGLVVAGLLLSAKKWLTKKSKRSKSNHVLTWDTLSQVIKHTLKRMTPAAKYALDCIYERSISKNTGLFISTIATLVAGKISALGDDGWFSLSYPKRMGITALVKSFLYKKFEALGSSINGMLHNIVAQDVGPQMGLAALGTIIYGTQIRSMIGSKYGHLFGELKAIGVDMQDLHNWILPEDVLGKKYIKESNDPSFTRLSTKLALMVWSVGNVTENISKTQSAVKVMQCLAIEGQYNKLLPPLCPAQSLVIAEKITSLQNILGEDSPSQQTKEKIENIIKNKKSEPTASDVTPVHTPSTSISGIVGDTEVAGDTLTPRQMRTTLPQARHDR